MIETPARSASPSAVSGVAVGEGAVEAEPVAEHDEPGAQGGTDVADDPADEGVEPVGVDLSGVRWWWSWLLLLGWCEADVDQAARGPSGHRQSSVNGSRARTTLRDVLRLRLCGPMAAELDETPLGSRPASGRAP